MLRFPEVAPDFRSRRNKVRATYVLEVDIGWLHLVGIK